MRIASDPLKRRGSTWVERAQMNTVSIARASQPLQVPQQARKHKKKSITHSQTQNHKQVTTQESGLTPGTKQECRSFVKGLARFLTVANYGCVIHLCITVRTAQCSVRRMDRLSLD